MTELLGILAMLAEMSGLAKGTSTVLGMGFKRRAALVPGDAENGDEELSDFQGEEADSLLSTNCVAPTFHDTPRLPNP